MSSSRLVYFECDVEGHEDNLLNMVCIDNNCKQKGLICCLCQYYNHSNHIQKPLKVFLNEYKGLLAKSAKLLPNSSLTPGNGSNASPALNLKKCKQVYDSIITKVDDEQGKLQEDLINIQRLARIYYEEQISSIKERAAEMAKSEEQADGGLKEFVNSGKQIIESVERSVPIKPEEQRNLVNQLAGSIVIAGEKEIQWKGDDNAGKQSGKRTPASPGQSQENVIEDMVLIAESNLMEVERCLDSFCGKISTIYQEFSKQLQAMKDEISNETKKGLQQQLAINNNKKPNSQNNNNQQKPPARVIINEMEIEKTEKKKPADSFEDSEDMLRKAQNFLASRNTGDIAGEKIIEIARQGDDQEPSQSTCNFSVCKEQQNNGKAVVEKKEELKNIDGVKQPIQRRGYAEKLTSLNKLNKSVIINRQNSDLQELFSSSGDSSFRDINSNRNSNSNSNSNLNSNSNIIVNNNPRRIDYFDSIAEIKNSTGIGQPIQELLSNDKDEDAAYQAANQVLKQSNQILQPVNNGFKRPNEDPGFQVEMKLSIKAHKGICKDIAFIDESRIASCSFDNFVKIWDTTTGHCLVELKTHTKKINCIAYSSTFSLLISGSDDCKAIAYKDLGGDDWREVLNLQHDYKVQCCAFFESEDQVLIGLETGDVVIWSISSGQKIKTMQCSKERISCLRVIVDKKFLLVAAQSNLSVWKISQSKLLSTKANAHIDTINEILFLRHAGEECFATASDDKTIKIWSLADYSIIMEFQESHCISSLQYIPQPINALAVSIWGEQPNGYVSFWSLADIKRVHVARQKKDGITKIRYFPDNKLLACAIDNGLLEIYAVSPNKQNK